MPCQNSVLAQQGSSDALKQRCVKADTNPCCTCVAKTKFCLTKLMQKLRYAKTKFCLTKLMQKLRFCTQLLCMQLHTKTSFWYVRTTLCQSKALARHKRSFGNAIALYCLVLGLSDKQNLT